MTDNPDIREVLAHAEQGRQTQKGLPLVTHLGEIATLIEQASKTGLLFDCTSYHSGGVNWIVTDKYDGSTYDLALVPRPQEG